MTVARYDPPRLEHITWLDEDHETDGHVLVAHEGERLVVMTRVARNRRHLSDPILLPRADILARVAVSPEEFFSP